MPTMLKLVPISLAAALLAGCSSGAHPDGAARVAASPSTSASSSPPAPADTPPATCGIDSPCGDGDTHSAPPPPVASTGVPDACTLVTQQDLRLVTFPDVALEFTGDPTDEPPHFEPATGRGYTSFCRHVLRSRFADVTVLGSTDISTSDGQVEVRVQSTGAELYFPVRAGDTAVDGLDGEAMLRYTTLYVRVGRGVLVIQVGITSASGGHQEIIWNRDIAWAKKLAKLALDRL